MALQGGDMPDFERLTDSLAVHMAKLGYELKGKNADYWKGYSKGKDIARVQVAAIFTSICFAVVAVRYFSGT
jgi:hypothetical protein